MWATIAFLLIFALMIPQIKEPLFRNLGLSGDWFARYAPFSYIVLAMFVAAAIAATILMIKWPGVQEPEDPLAKYKKGDDVLPD
jgi:hypothetical protein